MQIQGSAVHCLAMQCNGRDWIAFHCIAFRRIVLHFFTARGIALHCIVVSCIAGVDHRNNMIYVNRYTTVTIYPVLPNKVCSQEGGRRRNKTNKHVDAALAASCTRSLVAARRIGYFELRPFSIVLAGTLKVDVGIGLCVVIYVTSLPSVTNIAKKTRSAHACLLACLHACRPACMPACNAMQRNALQYNAVQCNAMQCNACIALQCNAMQRSAMQGNAVQCNAVQCMQCIAMQCNAIQCNASRATQCTAMQCNAKQCEAEQGKAMQCNACLLACMPACLPARMNRMLCMHSIA